MQMDGRAICYRCGGSAHDLVSHEKFEMTLQCCYCLAFTKIFGSPPEQPDAARRISNPGSYVLKHGRHKGETIDGVAKLGERGLEYLRMLSADSPVMKAIIEEYFDSRSAVNVQAASSHLQPQRSPSRQEASISGSP